MKKTANGLMRAICAVVLMSGCYRVQEVIVDGEGTDETADTAVDTGTDKRRDTGAGGVDTTPWWDTTPPDTTPVDTTPPDTTPPDTTPPDTTPVDTTPPDTTPPDTTPPDTETGRTCTGEGVWPDSFSELCWQDPPQTGMTWSSAMDYCRRLDHSGYSDWRLPDIDELITLLRGCEDGAVTDDLRWSHCEMTPEGCASADQCGGTTRCRPCAWEIGPGTGGCYRDPALGGLCGMYWSSSGASEFHAWRVEFSTGGVLHYSKNNNAGVRCVRDGPPCTPGSSRCSGDNYQICDTTRKWVTRDICPYGCNGVTGCFGECETGEIRCDGNHRQRCVNYFWRIIEECPVSCLPAGCTEMEDCAGGKRNPATGLCWEEPPSTLIRTWSTALEYCDSLNVGGHTDWRLPDIDELIGLLRGCPDGAATGDLSPSLCEMSPDGCAATDTCDQVITCRWCPVLQGPGDGCYRDPAFGGTCHQYYWSSSSHADVSTYAWNVDFQYANVNRFDKSTFLRVRCVRNDP